MTQLKMLSADDKLAEIRRLYFKTSKQSIQQDLAKALDLLKSMDSEDDRERATVFMEGLAEMQKDWLKAAGKAGKPRVAGRAGGAGRTAGKAGGAGRSGKPGAAAGKAGKPARKR